PFAEPENDAADEEAHQTASDEFVPEDEWRRAERNQQRCAPTAEARAHDAEEYAIEENLDRNRPRRSVERLIKRGRQPLLRSWEAGREMSAVVVLIDEPMARARVERELKHRGNQKRCGMERIKARESKKREVARAEPLFADRCAIEPEE